ncbi:MAG: peptide chain release factor 1 [Chloroflexota bacterium]|nr:peptide chain release factor 1 [Chloroflexota bacterium]
MDIEPGVRERLELIERRYEELNRLLADPEVATDYHLVKEYGQEQAELEPLVQKIHLYQQAEGELAEARSLLEEELDPEMRAFVQEEIARLEEEGTKLIEEIHLMLLPKDPRDERNVIMEIRAGAGGDEAALFAADLYRMYTKYAESQSWPTELLSVNEIGVGGFKEVILKITGRGAFSRLKYESGVHRVQRVPITESSGRIHTSTATVAVLPEAEEVEVQIDPSDLRIDVFGASGPGGQHMQKNATAVRITHKPSGIVVACQSERSQFRNRERAMDVLRARLYAMKEEKRQREEDARRRSQIGAGERSEKIRTYNFPQNRVTDHRINLSVYNLPDVLEGALDPFIKELIAADQRRQLEELAA